MEGGGGRGGGSSEGEIERGCVNEGGRVKEGLCVKGGWGGETVKEGEGE